MEDNEIIIDLNDNGNDIEIQRNETIIIPQDDYNELYNKPQINNVELIGNKTSTQLGLASEANAGAVLDLSIDSSTYVMTLQLKNINGTVLSTGTVDLPIESMIINASYDSATKSLILTLQNGNTITVGISDLISGLVNTDDLVLNYYSKVQINNQIGAPAYDNTATYEVGDIVLYNNKLYACTTDITVAEEWDSSHWNETNVLSSAGGNEVIIGTEADITGKTKIFINESEGTDAYSEVVDSLSGNELNKAPSVHAVKETFKTTDWATDTNGGFSYRFFNGIVYIRFNDYQISATANTWYDLSYLPTEFRPVRNLFITGANNGYDSMYLVRVTTAGKLSIYPLTSGNIYINGLANYII